MAQVYELKVKRRCKVLMEKRRLRRAGHTAARNKKYYKRSKWNRKQKYAKLVGVTAWAW